MNGSERVMSGKKAAEYKGIGQFFAYLSRPDVAAASHQRTGYLPVTKASFELTDKSGFYKKNPGTDVSVTQMIRKTTDKSRGVRLGNFVQIRTIIDEELEQVWSGKKAPKEALDAAIQRGNETCERVPRVLAHEHRRAAPRRVERAHLIAALDEPLFIEQAIRRQETLPMNVQDLGAVQRRGQARQILGFGEYGFLESHSVSFALLAYVSAWLKCHYPAAFTAALLNSQPMGFYAPAQLVGDARAHGVEVREIDVSHSDWDNRLEGERQDLGVLGGLRGP